MFYAIVACVFFFFNFTFDQVQCGEIEVEKKIDDKIEQFITWIGKHPNKKSQVPSFSLSLSIFIHILVLLFQFHR